MGVITGEETNAEIDTLYKSPRKMAVANYPCSDSSTYYSTGYDTCYANARAAGDGA